MSNLTYPQAIKIAAPMLLANLSIPLLGLVDTAILGHQEDAVYLGAVALGSQLIGLLFWAFGFLRMGTTGFTARALGARNQTDIQTRLQEACLFGGLIGLLIVLAQPQLLPFAIGLISDKGTRISLLALEYAQIRVWAAPAALITYALVGWLIGLEKTRAAMWILIVTNVVNIALDYVLIVQLNMASAGAAWASLISEYLGLFAGLFFVYLALGELGGLKISGKAFNWQAFKEMFTTSRHLFVRTLCLLLTFLFFTSRGAFISPEIAAANAILLNLLSLTAYTMDGFAFAAETLCGQAWGAKSRERFIDACKKTTVLAACLATICFLILVTGQERILGVYTDLPGVLQAAEEGYLWLAFMPLIAIWSYQLDGIFIGIGKSFAMQNAMMFSTFCIFLPIWWLSQPLGNTGLWLAFFSFQAARVITLAWPYAKLAHLLDEQAHKNS